MRVKSFFILSTLLCMALLSGCTSKASATRVDTLAPVMENGMCGYVDTEGNLIIPPQFEDCGVFSSDGLASACKDGKYGYIDTSGAFVIRPRFDAA